MKVLRDILDSSGHVLNTIPIFDIMECTYSGKDMGERSITATIKFPAPIDFKIGDYVQLQLQDLCKSPDGLNGNTSSYERFYIYSMPTIKKTARSMSCGDAFEHTVTFYPRQYELGCVQFRDVLQKKANADNIIYTGFDTVNFYGGAKELMERVMAVLKERYAGEQEQWSYVLAPGLDETINTALESFAFSFSGNSVMDAVMKLADKEGINTTFFINGRTIYVGYKRPYLCRVDNGNNITGTPLNLTYGKTSDKPIDIDHGGLFSITKSVGKEQPITKLFAYGASRNLNRYYCSDRIRGGRYVNRLMLPSFDADGETDYILSEEGIKRHGVREGSKTFDEIYPSLRYMTYGDLRQIKYVLKIKGSGLEHNMLEHSSKYAYPVARIQCYKVVPYPQDTQYNMLVECAPPDDIAVSVHATGKVVRTILYGDSVEYVPDGRGGMKVLNGALQRQLYHDSGHVPTKEGEVAYIPGSCFLVHDPGFTPDEEVTLPRKDWFEKPVWDGPVTDREKEIELHQIEYVDTFWFTDMYKFESYGQRHFSRDGYSAYAWPRTNNSNRYTDATIVNEIVAVEPITLEDTSLNISEKRYQKTFDVYLRDVGFGLDEQNDFGEMVFVYDDVKLSFLDGNLAGREYSFIVPNQSNVNAICARRDDGSVNPDFLKYASDVTLATQALIDGAMWRVTCARVMEDDQIGLILPMKGINAAKGDHVVFLDLYMPDIYVHAAENRLLLEAKKFLNANDKGKVNYSVELDKVRIQQISNYALQMREGVTLRLVDEDLSITSDNCITSIYSDVTGSIAARSMLFVPDKYAMFEKVPVSFLADKHYTVVVDFKGEDPEDDGRPDLVLFNSQGQVFSLDDLSIASEPSPTRATYTRYTYEFDLPNNFNDSTVYYIGKKVVKNDETLPSAYLMSVEERNTAEEGEIVKYVDFTVDSVNIKIHDNTRPADEQITEFQPEIVREVQATLAENTIASAWSSLMNAVSENSKEVDEMGVTYANIVNEARKHYRELLALRFSIFDPDADTDNPCTQTFVHAMMMQVGADSMNFTLHKTKQSVTGLLSNCEVVEGVGGAPDQFRVYNEDQLDHYVYTDGAQGGSWLIPGNVTANLIQVANEDDEMIWPTYYVCIKCRKDDVNHVGEDGWIISTKQYAVNDTEDENCWFFNWGILTPDSSGHYKLTVTRGNAYMYGDKLICGRISSAGKNSWFDLDSGNFRLGTVDGEPSMLYQNGVLVINGAKGDFLNGIGGRNLIGCDNPLHIIEKSGDNSNYKVLIGGYTGDYAVNRNYLTPGKEYVFSCARSEVTAGSATKFSVVVYNFAASSSKTKVEFTLPIGNTLQTHTFKVPADAGDKCSLIIYAGENRKTAGVGMKFYDLMLQEGNKYTAYQPYTQHLADAFKGSTEIAGGVVMSNILMLKNEQGDVTAGMSGLVGTTDDPENLLAWGGGTYNEAIAQTKQALSTLQKVLPVLITKNGIGSMIGCFKVESHNEVSVTSSDGIHVMRINTDTGIKMFENGNLKTHISPEPLTMPTERTSRSFTNKSGTITIAANTQEVVTIAEMTALSVYNRVYFDKFYADVEFADSFADDVSIGVVLVIGNTTYTLKDKEKVGTPCTIYPYNFKQQSVSIPQGTTVRVRLVIDNKNTKASETITYSCGGLVKAYFHSNSTNRTILANNGLLVYQGPDSYVKMELNDGLFTKMILEGLPNAGTGDLQWSEDLSGSQLYRDGNELKLYQPI